MDGDGDTSDRRRMDPRLDRMLDEFEKERDEGRTPKLLHQKIDTLTTTVDEHEGRITTLETHRQRDAEDRFAGVGAPTRHPSHPDLPATPPAPMRVVVESSYKRTSTRPPWTSAVVAGAAKKIAPWLGAAAAAWALGHFGTGPLTRTPAAAAVPPMAVYTTTPTIEVPSVFPPSRPEVNAISEQAAPTDAGLDAHTKRLPR